MWRGVSLRKLSYQLLGPMIVETLSMMFVFYMALAAVRMGIEPRYQMLIGVTGSIFYAGSSIVCGRWVRPHNAPNIMLAAIMIMTAAGISALNIHHFGYFLLIGPVIAICASHFYVSFQVNMRSVQPFHTLAWTVAIYNVAWGLGGAAGPFLSGSLRLSPLWLLVALALVLMTAHSVLNLQARTAPPPPHHDPTRMFASSALQRRMSMIATALSCTVYRGFYVTIWPTLGAQRGWDDTQIAWGALMLALPLPVVAPLWARLRFLLDQPWILMSMLALGIAGVLVLPMTQSLALTIAGLTCIGLAESCCVFHMIYYANADPHNSARSIGIAEFIAGMGFLLGPMIMGLIAWNDATAPRTYFFAAGLMTAALLSVVILWWRGGQEGPA